VDAPAPSRAEKFFRHNLLGKFESAPPSTPSVPKAEQDSILGHFAMWGRFRASISSFRPSFEGDK